MIRPHLHVVTPAGTRMTHSNLTAPRPVRILLGRRLPPALVQAMGRPKHRYGMSGILS
jgi:hypothetical protein